MVVRIRFRVGPRVEKRIGKNGKLAWLAGGVLSLGTISCLFLGLWRLGVDFGWAGEFVFPNESVFSHWQVWLLASILIQVISWKLSRYGIPPGQPPVLEGQESGSREKKQVAAKA
jgi:hypothetical protein